LKKNAKNKIILLEEGVSIRKGQKKREPSNSLDNYLIDKTGILILRLSEKQIA